MSTAVFECAVRCFARMNVDTMFCASALDAICPASMPGPTSELVRQIARRSHAEETRRPAHRRTPHFAPKFLGRALAILRIDTALIGAPFPSASRRRSACPPLLAPTVWGRNHPSTTGLHRNAGSSICAIGRYTGITRKSLSDPAQEVVMSPRAVRKLRIQCLPDVSRNHVWRTGTSVNDIGGDHNLKVLVLPVRGQPPSELFQVVGIGDKLA